MHLISPRKHLYQRIQIEQRAKSVSLTDGQLEAVREWARLLDSGKLVDEESNYGNFQEYIMRKLLGHKDVEHERDRIDFVVPDANGEYVLAVECKDTNTDLDERQHRPKLEHSTPMKQLWDQMGGCRLGICTNYRVFRLVKRSEGNKTWHETDFKDLYDGPDLNCGKIAEFVYVFGHIVRNGDDDLDAGLETEDKDLTDRFYRLFRNTRRMMTKEFVSCGAGHAESGDVAQTFLNRLVFLFFAEDRDLVKGGLFMDQVTGNLDTGFPDEYTDAVCRGIRDELFRVLDKGHKPREIPGFNGGLFCDKAVPNMRNMTFVDYRDTPHFEDVVPDPAPATSRKVQEIMKKHPRLSPIIQNMMEMRQYNFRTDIDVNILGHVFEQSIQELEVIRKKPDLIHKIEGIYYTPSYITDWICRRTILPYLSMSGRVQEPEELVREYAENGQLAVLEKRLRELRILDPACGSGAFLTSAAGILFEIHGAVHDTHALSGRFLTPAGLATLDNWSADSIVRNIVSDNIYGIDKNPQSVRIAQLAMFLLTANDHDPLPDTSDHIMVGNSIVSDDAISPVALKWPERFKGVFESDDPGFDIIVGNPPYGAKLTDDERKHLNKKFGIGGTNTAALFIHQSLSLLKQNGMHGFIVPKSLMFSSREWTKTREALVGYMVALVDVGKVWKNVKLEQCVYIMHGCLGGGGRKLDPLPIPSMYVMPTRSYA